MVKKSADLGEPQAQALLGGMYLNGWYVKRNYKKARKLLLQSINNHCPIGYTHLAATYEFGTGIKKNIPEAIKWYKKAAANGDEIAQDRLNNLLSATAE